MFFRGVPSKDFTINGEKFRMTTEEYNRAKKDFGQTTKGIFDDLVTTKEYRSLSSEGKAKAISDVYSYAKEKLKVEYAQNQGKEVKQSTLYKTVAELEKQKGDVSAYFEFKGKLDDVDKSNGDDTVKQKEKLEYLRDMTTDSKTKSIIYQDTFGTKDTTYQNLKLLTKDNVAIDDYLDYKTEDLSADRKADGTKKGKAISGSAKAKLTKFLNNSKLSGIERLYIYGQKQKLSSTQRNQLVNYVNKLKITPQEKKDIYLDLSSNNVVEMADGSIRWK